MVSIHLLHHRAKEKKEAWRAFPLLYCVSHLLDYELYWLDELHNSKDDGTAEGSPREAPHNLENLFLSFLGRL